MTDPVDTDALRDVTRNEGLWEAEASLITAAADEVDRLRTIIDTLNTTYSVDKMLHKIRTDASHE